MTKNESGSNTTVPNAVVTKTDTVGTYAGWLGILFGCLGIIFLGIIFFPLTLIMAWISLWKKNYLLGIISSILAILIFATSPTLWGLVALKGVYDKGIQEQARIDKVAQRVIETKRQEDASKNEKPTAVSTENKAPVVTTTDAGKCESTQGRTYVQSHEFFWNVYKVGWSRLDELTTDDLNAVLFSPWLDNAFVTKVETAFGNEVQKNRKELSSLTSGKMTPNLEAINGKYEYTHIGTSLMLKYTYIRVLGSIRKNFGQENTKENDKILASRDALKKAIGDFTTGNTPTEPIAVSTLGKNGELDTKILIIKIFPSGHFGILISEPTVANTPTTEIY